MTSLGSWARPRRMSNCPPNDEPESDNKSERTVERQPGGERLIGGVDPCEASKLNDLSPGQAPVCLVCGHDLPLPGGVDPSSASEASIDAKGNRSCRHSLGCSVRLDGSCRQRVSPVLVSRCSDSQDTA